MKTQTNQPHGRSIWVATRAVALFRGTLIGILLTGTQLSIGNAGNEPESDASQALRNPVLGETQTSMSPPYESSVHAVRPTCAELGALKLIPVIRDDATRYQLGCGTGNLLAHGVSAGQ